MKTIEERAKEYADSFVVGDSAVIVDLMHKVAEDSYIKGATEQKEIDKQHTLMLQDAHESEKKMLIEKALAYWHKILDDKEINQTVFVDFLAIMEK